MEKVCLEKLICYGLIVSFYCSDYVWDKMSALPSDHDILQEIVYKVYAYKVSNAK